MRRRGVDRPRDDLGAHERPRRIMDQHDVARRQHRVERVRHRILTARSPPATTRTPSARPAAPTPSTWAAPRRHRRTRDAIRNASTRVEESARPPTASSCFGTSAPSRVRVPPAAMIAVTCMDELCERWVKRSLYPGVRHADGARPLPSARSRARARRTPGACSRVNTCGRNRRVNGHRHVAGAGHQPALQHHVTAAGDADRNDRQSGLDRQRGTCRP